jgi:preprotein translocase subunit SecY
MFQNFLHKMKIIFTDPFLLKKIGFVLVMLIVFRLLGAIPLPGIDPQQLAAFLGNNQFFAFLSLFSGGGLTQLSLVALGVGPYITATIIMQLMTVMVPKLKTMYHEEGEQGRKKFNQISRWLSVGFGVLQAVGLSAWMQSQGVIMSDSFFAQILLVVMMVAGATLVMWIGELISEFGIGNGVSLIIFAGIVAQLPSSISQGAFTYDPSQLPLFVAIVLIVILMVFISVLVTEAERPIPVHYAKQVRAGYTTGGTDTYIPLRISLAGVMPIIFAGSIMQLPQIATAIFANTANETILAIVQKLAGFTYTNIWYMVVYFILIFFFTYFYTAVTFDAESMANNLQKNGAFVPGVRPGNATADYVATILSRTTFIGAVFISLIAVMPFIIQRVTGNPLFAIGGTGLLIAISVSVDLIKKLGAQASMREY